MLLKMSSSLESLTSSIADGFSLLRQVIMHPPQQPFNMPPQPFNMPPCQTRGPCGCICTTTQHYTCHIYTHTHQALPHLCREKDSFPSHKPFFNITFEILAKNIRKLFGLHLYNLLFLYLFLYT